MLWRIGYNHCGIAQSRKPKALLRHFFIVYQPADRLC